MKVTFHQLQVFECVAKHLSFTRAAEELSLSQPTVSAQIRQLSSETGLPLFEQIGKTVNLTAAGRELLAASREVFRVWSGFEMNIADMRGIKRGRLAIACATTAKYFAPGLLGPFCRNYPEVEVSLTIVNHDALIERLRRNLDDLTVMTQPPHGMDVEATALRADQLVLVAPAGHPLAGRKNIPLARLHGERFIMREPGSGTRIQVLNFFHSHQFEPAVRMELGSNEAIKHVVAAGLGVSVLSSQALDVDPAIDHLTVLDVEGFPIADQWFVVHPAGKRLSPVALAFHAYLLTQAAPAARKKLAAAPKALSATAAQGMAAPDARKPGRRRKHA